MELVEELISLADTYTEICNVVLKFHFPSSQLFSFKSFSRLWIVKQSGPFQLNNVAAKLGAAFGMYCKFWSSSQVITIWQWTGLSRNHGHWYQEVTGSTSCAITFELYLKRQNVGGRGGGVCVGDDRNYEFCCYRQIEHFCTLRYWMGGELTFIYLLYLKPTLLTQIQNKL